MPRNGSAAGSAQIGVGGALSRFSRRSYTVDYIALGFLVAGWVLVSGANGTEAVNSLVNGLLVTVYRFSFLPTLSIACLRSTTRPFNFPSQ